MLGTALWDYTGKAVSAAGDVNGDGIGDIIIGAYQADPPALAAGSNAGITYVLFGNRTGAFPDINFASMVSSRYVGFRILGAAANDNSGVSVSNAGDVNNDGVDDVIIGASGATTGTVGSPKVGAGITYVIFGRNVTTATAAFGDILLSSIVSGSSVGFRILGININDNSGSSVSAAGDVNYDGIDDVILGAPNSFYLQSYAGISYVVFGRQQISGAAPVFSADISLSNVGPGTTPGFKIVGAVGSDTSGSSVSGAGDVNNDGIDDVIVGSPGASTATTTVCGMSYVVFGKVTTTGVLITLSTLGSNPTLGFRIIGGEYGDFSGFPVSRAGDVNGDGIADVMISAPYATPPAIGATLRTNAGITYVLYGRNVFGGATPFGDMLLSDIVSGSTDGFRILGALTQDMSGSAIGAAGDVNNDGVDDIILGAQYSDPLGRYNAGTSYVIFGRNVPGGAARFRDVSLSSIVTGSTAGFRIIGTAGDLSGGAVSGAGDFNGDGVNDIIVGSWSAVPYTLPAATTAGMASVIFGSLTDPTSQPSSQPSRQPVSRPTSQPTRQPSRQPTMQPSSQPAGRPTSQPTRQPSSQPSIQPASVPTTQPSRQPSSLPSVQPSNQPSARPSAQPTSNPSAHPTGIPSTQPSSQPSSQPSAKPTSQPSVQPSERPSSQPTNIPSRQPTSNPTSQPSRIPTTQPSSLPSAQPLAEPTSQPSSLPSAQPSGGPSSSPTGVPSAQPSTVPTSRPSCQPSARPSMQPTGTPSTQPTTLPTSFPTTQPVSRPSGQPSRQPSSQPIAQPSTQPSVVPTSQPSRAPSCQPSVAPSAQPSHRPSSQPTAQPSTAPSAPPPTLKAQAEWAIISSHTSSLSHLSIVNSNLWACGSSLSAPTTSCVLVDSASGGMVTQYQFDWDRVVVPLLTTSTSDTIIVNGHATTSGDVASCTMTQTQLQCHVDSFARVNFLAASYVPYPNRMVYIGQYNVYLSATIVDLSLGTVRSYIYTLFNTKSAWLSQIQSPPSFVGSCVAGTSTRSAGFPAVYITTGLLRSDTGGLTAMNLSPVSGNILNSVDLVNAMALEYTGPDSFIGGGMELSDGAGMQAYILRANTLYSTVQRCVRYRSNEVPTSEVRRALSAASASSSAVRGVVLANSHLYAIIDLTHSNATSLTVLKTRADTGAIVKQAHIIALHASLHCTDITSTGLFLAIACIAQYNSSFQESVLMSVDRELSFSALPVGFIRNYNTTFWEESVPFQRTLLAVTASSTTVQRTTSYEFVTSNQGPTRRPSAAPSTAPSSQPSSAPSAQPSSSPTGEPSVSARPTSQPSSAAPTNTNKPTAAPTTRPTTEPSAGPSLRPSSSPTKQPTQAPSVKLTARPSIQPSVSSTVRPSCTPTARPTRAPSSSPTLAPTRGPTGAPTGSEDLPSATASHRNSSKSKVVGASVGGAAFLCLCCFVWYKHHQYVVEKKERDKRKEDFFAHQAKLVAALELEREDMMRQIGLEDMQRERKNTKRNMINKTGGAYAVGPALPLAPVSPVPSSLLNSDSSSSFAISSLHSSEVYSQEEMCYEEDEEEGEYVEDSEQYSEQYSDYSDPPPESEYSVNSSNE